MPTSWKLSRRVCGRTLIPLARISHQVAEHNVEKCLSLTSCGALFGVFRVQIVLGAPWLVFSPSARACSLEWCSGYALRSRARAEAENPAPSCTLEKSATPWVESRTGALTIGSGGYSVAFASGLSPAPLSRFQSPLSEPDVRFSRISALQWDHASRTQVPARIRGRLLWDWHSSPTPSTSAPGLPPGLLMP